jgi:hypothetical protein
MKEDLVESRTCWLQSEEANCLFQNVTISQLTELLEGACKSRLTDLSGNVIKLYTSGWTQGYADSVRESGVNNIQARHNWARGRFLFAVNLEKSFNPGKSIYPLPSLNFPVKTQSLRSYAVLSCIMDPIGATASIVALVELSLEAFKVVKNITQHQRKAPKEILDFKRQINGLRVQLILLRTSTFVSADELRLDGAELSIIDTFCFHQPR